MEIVTFTGFEQWPEPGWTKYGGVTFYQATPSTTGRTQKCQFFAAVPNETAGYGYRITPSGKVTVGFGYARGSTSDSYRGYMVSLFDTAGQPIVTVELGTSGDLHVRRGSYNTGTLLATLVDDLTTTAWRFYELTVVTDPVTGSVVLDKDGVTVVDLSAQDTGSLLVGEVRIGGNTSTSTFYGGRFDDLYIMTDTGPTHPDRLGPSVHIIDTNTSYEVGFQAGQLNEWTLVDPVSEPDRILDSLRDWVGVTESPKRYFRSTVADQRQSLRRINMTGTDEKGTVAAVRAVARVQSTSPVGARVGVMSSAGDITWGSVGVADVDTLLERVQTVDPAGGSWERATAVLAELVVQHYPGGIHAGVGAGSGTGSGEASGTVV